MCPSDKIVPHGLPYSPNRRPGGQGVDKHGRQTADRQARTQGSTPRYRTGQRPLPGGSTEVEGPRYLADGAAVPVAGSDRRTAPARYRPNGWKIAPSLPLTSLLMFARMLPDHLEVMCQHPGHNHPAGRPRTR